MRFAVLLSHFLVAQHVNPLACYMDLVALPFSGTYTCPAYSRSDWSRNRRGMAMILDIRQP